MSPMPPLQRHANADAQIAMHDRIAKDALLAVSHHRSTA